MATVVDEELDLSGISCPYTFVHTKLKLEEMEVGQILSISIDHPPASKTLPQSLTYEGHRVVSVSELAADRWRIVVQKCAVAD